MGLGAYCVSHLSIPSHFLKFIVSEIQERSLPSSPDCASFVDYINNLLKDKGVIETPFEFTNEVKKFLAENRMDTESTPYNIEDGRISDVGVYVLLKNMGFLHNLDFQYVKIKKPSFQNPFHISPIINEGNLQTLYNLNPHEVLQIYMQCYAQLEPLIKADKDWGGFIQDFRQQQVVTKSTITTPWSLMIMHGYLSKKVPDSSLKFLDQIFYGNNSRYQTLRFLNEQSSQNFRVNIEDINIPIVIEADFKNNQTRNTENLIAAVKMNGNGQIIVSDNSLKINFLKKLCRSWGHVSSTNENCNFDKSSLYKAFLSELRFQGVLEEFSKSGALLKNFVVFLNNASAEDFIGDNQKLSFQERLRAFLKKYANPPLFLGQFSKLTEDGYKNLKLICQSDEPWAQVYLKIRERVRFNQECYEKVAAAAESLITQYRQARQEVPPVVVPPIQQQAMRIVMITPAQQHNRLIDAQIAVAARAIQADVMGPQIQQQQVPLPVASQQESKSRIELEIESLTQKISQLRSGELIPGFAIGRHEGPLFLHLIQKIFGGNKKLLSKLSKDNLNRVKGELNKFITAIINEGCKNPVSVLKSINNELINYYNFDYTEKTEINCLILKEAISQSPQFLGAIFSHLDSSLIGLISVYDLGDSSEAFLEKVKEKLQQKEKAIEIIDILSYVTKNPAIIDLILEEVKKLPAQESQKMMGRVLVRLHENKNISMEELKRFLEKMRKTPISIDPETATLIRKIYNNEKEVFQRVFLKGIATRGDSGELIPIINESKKAHNSKRVEKSGVNLDAHKILLSIRKLTLELAGLQDPLRPQNTTENAQIAAQAIDEDNNGDVVTGQQQIQQQKDKKGKGPLKRKRVNEADSGEGSSSSNAGKAGASGAQESSDNDSDDDQKSYDQRAKRQK